MIVSVLQIMRQSRRLQKKLQSSNCIPYNLLEKSKLFRDVASIVDSVAASGANVADDKKSLVVKKSQLISGGQGLFTTTFVKKGQMLIEYKGLYALENNKNSNCLPKLSLTRRFKSHQNHKYCYGLTDNICICALDTQFSNEARFINDLDYNYLAGRYASTRRNNLEFKVLQTGQVMLVATKDIKAGTELGVRYGKDYWDFR